MNINHYLNHVNKKNSNKLLVKELSFLLRLIEKRINQPKINIQIIKEDIKRIVGIISNLNNKKFDHKLIDNLFQSITKINSYLKNYQYVFPYEIQPTISLKLKKAKDISEELKKKHFTNSI